MKKLLLLLLCFIYVAQVEGQNIITVAGTSSWGYNGDGVQATAANLYNPNGVAFDVSGNLYIADAANYRIRKINSTGIITTIAGGTYGFYGDGGPATAAKLATPSGIAFDALGNLYIADAGNNRVRMVNT